MAAPLMSGTRRSQRGVVLIAVLWVVVILMLVATGVTGKYRTEQRITRNALDATRAWYAAEGGIYYALSRLEHYLGQGQARAQLPDVHLVLGDASVNIEIQDERGKVDLNTAQGQLIRGVFLGAGLPFDQADRLSDAILDWRDADDLRHPHGAEAGDYRREGYGHGPRNADFETVDELKQVLGMTPEIYERVRPAFTVYSGAPDINPQAAPALVLRALPGIEPEMLRGYLDARRQNQAEGLPPPPFPLGNSPYVSDQVGPAYRLKARARVGGQAEARVSAIVIREAATGDERMRIAAWNSYGEL